MAEEKEISSWAVFGTLDAIAALSNLAVLVLIFRSERTRSVGNFFVAALVLAELLMTILVVPFSIASFSKKWRYGDGFCVCHGYLHNFLSSASATFISLVSIEKFYCLTNPMRHAANVSPRKVIITILFIWLQAAFLAAFPLFNIGSLKYLFIPSKMTCGFAWDLGGLYGLYYFVVSMGSFVMPAFTICLMSYKTLQTARRSANQIRPGNITFQVLQNGDYTSVARQDKFVSLKANLILLTITGTFLVCRLPLGLSNISTAIHGRSLFPVRVEGIFGWLLYLGSLINPYVYTLLNRGLRREISQVAKMFRKTAAVPEEQEPKDLFEYLRTLTENNVSRVGGQVGGEVTATDDNGSGVVRTASQTGGTLQLQVSVNDLQENAEVLQSV